MAIQYQNPNQANVTAILDSEIVATDPTTAQPVVREFVVPQESISNQDPYSKQEDLLVQMLDELKKIRTLLEQDVPPGLAEDVLDESVDTSGPEEEGFGSEGIEEF
jgi:hypothetical protein